MQIRSVKISFSIDKNLKRVDEEICITSKVLCVPYLQILFICIVYINKHRRLKYFMKKNVCRAVLVIC